MNDVIERLGEEAKTLLDHRCTTIPKESLTLPGPDYVDRIFANSDRSNTVLRNLQGMFNHGRLRGTGYLPSCRSTRGIEPFCWSSSFAPNPIYF